MELLQTTHPRILHFYNKYPNIDFESQNLQLIDFYERISASETTPTSQNKLLEQLQNILNNKPNIDKEITHLPTILNKMFTTCEATLFSSKIEEISLFLFKRPFEHSRSPLSRIDFSNPKPNILIASLEEDRNVNTEEIQAFSKIIEEHRYHGIFISQKGGVSGKPNYHIDYMNGNVVVYLHNGDHCKEKIKIAIDIIDNISGKLKDLNHSNGESAISKAVLDEINKEYQLFLSQKEALIGVYKDCQKKVLAQIDEIRFPNLDKYLSTKYTAQPMKQGFKCDLCKSFNANNLKALAAHKRGCQRKNILVTTVC